MFDIQPEDLEQQFKCEACESGNLILNADKTAYECDVCNAYHEIKRPTND